jgi:hypothetical protein
LVLRRLRVFVDQTVEDRVSLDAHDRLAWRCSGRVGWLLSQSLMWAMIIVVLGVFGQDRGQVSLAEDEHSVGALAAYGAHPAFGMGVRAGCLRWGADDLHAGGGEDCVERGGELRVSVADQESEPVGVFVECHQQISGLLGDPCAGGVGGDADDVDLVPFGNSVTGADVRFCPPWDRRLAACYRS